MTFELGDVAVYLTHLVTMAVGAGITYGVIKTKMAQYESRIGSIEKDLNGNGKPPKFLRREEFQYYANKSSKQTEILEGLERATMWQLTNKHGLTPVEAYQILHGGD